MGIGGSIDRACPTQEPAGQEQQAANNPQLQPGAQGGRPVELILTSRQGEPVRNVQAIVTDGRNGQIQVIVLPEGGEGQSGQPGALPARGRVPPSLLNPASVPQSSRRLERTMLSARGQSESQANRNIVEQQVQEDMHAFLLYISCTLLCILVSLAIALSGVYIWVAVALGQDRDQECDTPLRVYAFGVFALLIWSLGLSQCFVQNCLGYDADQDGPVWPLKVKVYVCGLTLLMVIWYICGMVWVHQGSCHDTAPNLWNSVRIMVYLQVCMSCANLLQGLFSTYIRWAIRTGRLRLPPDPNATGAPDVIHQLETLKFDAAKFDDATYPKECCICQNDFCAGDHGDNAILMTPCKHVFHKHCLGNWLESRKTCPICRTDLSTGAAEPGEPAV